MAFDFKRVTAGVKRYPTPVGLGILSLALLGGIIVRGARARELAGLAREKEQAGQTVLENVRDGASAAEQYAALAADIRDLESRLVQGTERAANQQYFYRLESETGVKEINLQPSAPAKGKAKTQYAGIGFTVSVQGDYRQILGFIGRLETGPHFFRMIRASLSRSDASPETKSAALTLTLSLEFLGLP